MQLRRLGIVSLVVAAGLSAFMLGGVGCNGYEDPAPPPQPAPPPEDPGQILEPEGGQPGTYPQPQPPRPEGPQ